MLSPDSSARPRHLARVWLGGARASLVREMEFRANFYSGLARQLLWFFSFVLMIHVIFANTPTLAGWSQSQVLILLALSRLIEGLADAFFHRNIGDLPEAVQTGKFDFYLLRPVPVQFYTALRRLRFLDLGNAAIGVLLLTYTASHEPALFTAAGTLSFLLLVVLGMTIYYSILLTLASLVFFLDRMDAFAAISNLVSEPLTVPFDIFPAGLKTALTYLIPLAFVVFIPAQALTGHLAPSSLPLALLTAAISLTVANLVWRAGLKRYSSASS